MRRRPTSMPGRRAGLRARAAAAIATVVLAGMGSSIFGSGVASAQSLLDSFGQSGQPANGEKSRMLVEAKELIYNRDTDVVTANGNVQIYYQGKILQADRVVYNRKTKRVVAEGNTKLTEPDGTVSYGTKFELTDDFRDGFINSLKARTVDNGTITAPRGERIGAETTVFDRATYTSCAPCAEHPERPPLWQIRATKIIHKNQEQTLYYENATMELLGFPIAYFPYLSSPDGSVNRKTGFLPPHYIYSDNLGYGIGVPFFWAIAPNYDLTLTPTYLTRQGVLGEVEFRQRLMTGSYKIVATGIFQNEPTAFPAAPYDTQKQFRGSLQTEGKFYLSEKFSVGWDATYLTDKFYPYDYKLKTDTVSYTNYFRDSTSTVYFNGQGDHGYFDLRGYYFQGLDQRDIQKQQPTVHPVMEYNKSFLVPKAESYGLGGQLTFDVNVTSISRDIADFQSTGQQSLDSTYNLFNTCTSTTLANPYVRGNCLLRGIGGEYNRATAQASWKRDFYDGFGGMWQPFAFARVSGISADLNTTSGLELNPTQSLFNANQSNYLSSTSYGTAMPGVGFEYRFPLVATTSWANQIFEPIAQVIVRPNEITSVRTINEDAQSLVFDDTNLFEWSKFSGYDRFEGGTRANVGAQYTAKFNWGGTLSAMAGQSYQLAGRNSYATPDLINTGLDSGLQNAVSDYITRVAFTPFNGYSFIAKGNFDPSTFALKRLDVTASATLGRRLSVSAQYARYSGQPDIGYYFPREGVLLSSRYNLTDHYFLNGSVVFDLSGDQQLDPTTGLQLPSKRFKVGSVSAGGGYDDECTNFTINYISGYSYGVGTETSGQAILAQLTFKTLGTIKASQTVGESTVVDNVVNR